LHRQIASQHEVGDDLPCADAKLLVPLKRSPEYRTIHPRLSDIRPIDSWQQDSLHYFVFPLKAADGNLVAVEDAPVAVFTMHPDSLEPVSVVVVTPSADGGEAEVANLRQPASGYTVPLAPWGVYGRPGSTGEAAEVGSGAARTETEETLMAAG
jgi:hypothetical protein